jgi:hypothetical protein
MKILFDDHAGFSFWTTRLGIGTQGWRKCVLMAAPWLFAGSGKNSGGLLLIWEQYGLRMDKNSPYKPYNYIIIIPPYK